VATSTNRLIRSLRTKLVPRVLPLALRFDWAVAYGFRTVSCSTSAIGMVQPSRKAAPGCAEDPRLATGSPMRASPETAQMLAGRGPGHARFHLLLCGPPADWYVSQLAALRRRYPETLVVHHLTREAITPGALHDLDGQAFARLGVDGAAHREEKQRSCDTSNGIYHYWYEAMVVGIQP
jgi:hypothetical protein